MELRSFFQILWHRKWLILVTATVTVALIALGLSLIEPKYQATTVLRIATGTRGAPDWIDYSLDYSSRILNTYSQLAMSSAIQNEVVEQLDLLEPPVIEVEVPANTELFIVTAVHSDAAIAALAADLVAQLIIADNRRFSSESTQQFQEVLAAQLAQMETELTALQQELLSSTTPATTARSLEQQRWSAYGRLWEQYDQARVREALQASAIVVVSPAVTPVTPSAPNWRNYLVLGFLVGIIGSLGLVLLLENLDTKLYRPEQIRTISALPLVGTIPNIKQQRDIKLVNSNSFEGEAFHRFRTNLAISAHEASCEALMVTSAEAGEGKSTIAANLALSMAQAGQRVVLVDCDLRMPTLHRLFNLPNEVGLSTLLERNSTLAEAMQFSEPTGVMLLTSGPLPDRPAELLSSAQMIDVVNQLKQQFDMVIVDVPSLLAVADASILAHVTDQVLLVVQSGQTSEESARAAYQQLVLVHAPLLGIVMNRVPSNPGRFKKYFRTAI